MGPMPKLFVERTERGPAPGRFDAAELVRRSGGPPVLGEQYDALAALVSASRPGAVVVRSEAGAVDATYQEVLRIVSSDQGR